jgi:hypothetical protein
MALRRLSGVRFLVIAAVTAGAVPSISEELPEAEVTEVAPLAAKAPEADYPRALFWARGNHLVPLVCIAAKGQPWVQGAACQQLMAAPVVGVATSGAVHGQKWSKTALHEEGHRQTAALTTRETLGVGDDQQQEVSPEGCLVVAPSSVAMGFRVFPLPAAKPAELKWTIGSQVLHLGPAPYHGKKRVAPDSPAYTVVVSADGKHTWDGSGSVEEVGVVGTVDLAGDGRPLVVVHQRFADVGGDAVTVLDADLRPVGHFSWSLYVE